MENRLILADVASHNVNGRSVGHYFALARNYKDMFPNIFIAGGPIYIDDGTFCVDKLIKLPYDSNQSFSRLKIKWWQFRNMCSLMNQTKEDYVIIQQAATATVLLYLMFIHKKCKKLYFICYDDDAVSSTFKHLVYKIVKHKIDGIICPNDEVGMCFDRPYCVVPDYIYCSNQKVSYLKYANRKYDFAILGRLTEEKGIVEVADYFKGSKKELLIAGRPETIEIKNALEETAKNSPNIHLHLDYLTTDEYEIYLLNTRYAILNYQGKYSERSSGVVLDMLFHHIPVIGKKCKALQFVENFKCGVLYDELKNCNFDMLFNHEIHDTYLKNIEKYKSQQVKYIQKLYSFIIG